MNEKYNNNSSDSVYAILEQTQLEKFWPKIRDDLQINRLAHFDYVKAKDLENIGISKPAARRLLDHVKRVRDELNKKSNQFEISSKDQNRLRKAISLRAIQDDSLSNANIINSINTNATPSFIIGEHDLQISDKILGSGHFGICKKAIWKTPIGTKVNVAVKLIHENLLKESKQTLNDFLSEISYMCSLNHKHLTRLYGIVLTTQTKLIIMVTELAPLGSLLNFISDTNNINKILISQLYSYAYQISYGCEYLESKKLIHRDLAARNILLFSSEKIKICDFGMMRRLNDKNEFYKIETNSKIPFAWYPPESLVKKLFSIKSDVWTFAITLWEIFSFGERPWLNLNSQQILEKISKNERLPKPENCSSKMYSLLLKCWSYEPNERPSFSYLNRLIRELYPTEMKAKQDFKEMDRLEIKQGDTITVIEGNACNYWWKGQNNRTFKFGYFPRMLLDPQRRLNSEDISLPLKHSFIHTGHMSADANQVWGYPDKIDEIFLKNPLNPPDLLSNLSHENVNNQQNTNKVILIDFDDQLNDYNGNKNINYNSSKLTSKDDYVSTIRIINDNNNTVNYLNEDNTRNNPIMYENFKSDSKTLNSRNNNNTGSKIVPARPPPPPSSSSSSTPIKKSISSKNITTTLNGLNEERNSVKPSVIPNNNSNNNIIVTRAPPPPPNVNNNNINANFNHISSNNDKNQNNNKKSIESANINDNNNSNTNNNKNNSMNKTTLNNDKKKFDNNLSKNKIDIDEFLNKVMDDVINDLNSNSNRYKSNENKKQNQNPFFYSQQSLAIKQPLTSISTQQQNLPFNNYNLQNSKSSNDSFNNQQHLIYENFNSNDVIPINTTSTSATLISNNYSLYENYDSNNYTNVLSKINF